MKSHARFIKLGIVDNIIIATRLLKAYASSSSPDALSFAHQLFDEIPLKDAVLWTSLISAYTQAGHPTEALSLFSQMNFQARTKPNHFVFATAARACASIPHLRIGQIIHSCTIKHGFRPNVVVDTAILDMYSKCFAIDCSRRVFDEMLVRNIISWNAMIAGYANNGMGSCALEIFYRMKCSECQAPDEFAVASALSACANGNYLTLGKQIHAYVVCSGLDSDTTIANAAANMYFRYHEVEFAESMLTGREESAVMKIIKIQGHVFNRRYQSAIKNIGYDFAKVISMDHSIVVPALTACSNLSLLRIGRQIHGFIIVSFSYRGCQSDDEAAIIGTALIDMYSKCHSIQEAQRVFDNLPCQHVAHWNSMIAGYIHVGLLENAARCFGEMPERNVISWTTMISAYVHHGLPHEGLLLLAKMYHGDGSVRGNCFTFSVALDACSLLTTLDWGKQIHSQSIRTVIAAADANSIELETALVDMYSKSGNLNYAQRVFDQMRKRNVVSWTSMIMGYATHGHGSQALKLFQQMVDVGGMEPNEITFIAVLSACSHCGLLEEGLHYFNLMREKYGIIPWSDHYTCMIDLLGRAGKLAEAWSLIEELDESNDDDRNRGRGSILGALLGGCQLHGDVDMGSLVAKKMLEKRHQVSETYVALSNVYASAGMWDEVCRLRQEWRRQGVEKEPGLSHVHIGCFT